MALTMKTQLATSFQPDVEMSFTSDMEGGRGTDSESVRGIIQVRNKGNLPLRVVSGAVRVIFDSKTVPDQHCPLQVQRLVISPSGSKEIRFCIEVPAGSLGGAHDRRAVLDCSDLAGVSKHSFSISDREPEVNRYLGFQIT
jgi:hypothetical protein